MVSRLGGSKMSGRDCGKPQKFLYCQKSGGSCKSGRRLLLLLQTKQDEVKAKRVKETGNLKSSHLKDGKV